VSKGNTTEADYIAFMFNATSMPSYGAILYVSLHTADPGESGTQATNECAYGAYDRVAVTRDAGGWTLASNQSSNTAQVTFPECSSGTESATHVAIGTDDYPTAGQILYSGALTDAIAISLNITPLFPIAALVVTED
jgi:hypothetical protein